MKKIASLLLCAGLCVGLSTCFAAETAYEEAVAGLREVGYGTYGEEQTYDSDLCTLFSYSVTAPHGPFAHLDLVYKASSPLGEGAVVSLPVPAQNAWGASSAPDQLDWDPEEGQLTYSYYFDTPIYAEDFSSIRRAAGTFLYTVDLATGEVIETLIPPTYEDILERHFPEDHYAREQVLEAPGTTVLLLRQKIDDGGYSLHLVDRAETSDHRVRDLILPSTVVLDAYPSWFPTDRAPDRLSLSEDGKTLTYVYSFPDQLVSPYNGTTLHEAGTYTYTVDVATGKLSVSHSDGFTDGLALSLRELGLFLGNETGDFDLDRAPSRVEALVMLIRALGEDAQARAAGKTHPFTDVPAWADGYVSWGYAKGYTKGVSDAQFGATTDADARMYLTFMLRALGYSDGENGDFSWASPYLFARRRDLLPFEVDLLNFTRGDAVLVTSAALFVPERSQLQTLHERLEAAGSFTPEQFKAAFPQNLFAWQTTLRRKVDEALDAALEVGQVDHKTALVQSNTILDVSQDGNLFHVSALVCEHSLSDEELNSGEFGDYYSTLYTVEISLPKLAPHKSEILSCQPDAETVYYWDDPKIVLFRDDLKGVAQEKMTDLIASGTVKFRSPTYDEAVAELRGSWEYRNEQTIEAPDCTIFVYDPGGIMQRSYGAITLIYKPGSQLGAGTVIDLPHARVQYSVMGRPADTMALSEDGKTFTYTYYRPEDIVGWVEGVNEGEVLEKAGCVTYTVDLPTGAISERFDPPNYQAALAHVARRRIIAPDEHSEDREVVETLEADECTVVLTKGRYAGESDDYILSLVYKPGSTLGDGTIRQLLLPSTVIVSKSSSYHPTDRAPDSLFLAAGGSKLVYAYDFSDRLADGESVYHEAGRYTYTVDLKTGELSVDAPFKPDNIGVAYGSYQQAMDGLKNGQYPLSVDRQLETESCSLLMGHISAPHGGYYALRLVFKPGSQPGEGMVVNLPQPRINFWDNGASPTTLEISEDQRFLLYTYHFDEPFEFDGGILHEAGDYTYTVDLRTGVVAEELLPGIYDEALARCLQDEDCTVEQTLEGPFCTALLRYSHVDENGLAHQREGRKDYEITLVYKAGTGLPEGTLRSLKVPYTFSGRTADGLGIYVVSDRAPDSMAFSEDGKQFIYTYRFDAPLYDPQGDLVHEGGTYVYTVDVPSGAFTLDIRPN